MFQARSYQQHVAARAQQKLVEIDQYYKQQTAVLNGEMQGMVDRAACRSNGPAPDSRHCCALLASTCMSHACSCGRQFLVTYKLLTCLHAPPCCEAPETHRLCRTIDAALKSKQGGMNTREVQSLQPQLNTCLIQPCKRSSTIGRPEHIRQAKSLRTKTGNSTRSR